MPGPILDFKDDELHQIITMGMMMQLPPPLDELRDLMCELALRLREVRKFVKMNSKSIDGKDYIRADQLLDILDGG